MPEQLGQAVLELSTKGKGKTDRDIDSTHKKTKQLDVGFEKAKRTLNSVTSSLSKFGIALGALSVGALATFAKQQIATAANLADTADKLGLNIEALQEYRFAAAQVGVQQNTLDNALQRFTRRLGEAAVGEGVLKDTLEQYNIAVKNADGSTRRAEDVLGDFADAVQGAGDRTEQLRLVVRAFDIEGGALVNLLDKGSVGLNRFAVAAREAGVILDKEMIEEMREADKALTVLGLAFDAFSTRAANAIVPVINKFAELLGLVQRTDAEIQLRGVSQELEETSAELDRLGALQLKQLENRARIEEQLSKEAGHGIVLGEESFELQAQINETAERRLQLLQREIELREVIKGQQTGRGTPGLTPPTPKQQREAGGGGLTFVDGETIEDILDPSDIEEGFRGVSDLLVELEDNSRAIETAWSDIDSQIIGASENLVGGLIDGTLTWQDTLKSVLNTVLDIGSSLLQAAVNVPTGGGTGGASTGGLASAGTSVIGALLGKLFSAGEGGMVPGPFGSPQLAIVHGGEQVLTPQEINERGPVTVNNIDARGAAPGVSEEIRRALRLTEERAVTRSVGQVREQRQRGGSFTKAFE